ncbi:MAG: helix-turn-helix domain-containing protein [Bacteroidales bacterium]|nr:helix-turn-helix domain-containing protein [Bacteroidales bacterium]
MTKIKEASTNQDNRKNALTQCPVTYTLEKIGGRWKPIIIYNLLSGTKRYSELKKLIPAITEKMLIQHLKQLEADNLVHRKALPVIPPFVEYSLTDSGKELKPVLDAMVSWAMKNREKTSLTLSPVMEDQFQ